MVLNWKDGRGKMVFLGTKKVFDKSYWKITFIRIQSWLKYKYPMALFSNEIFHRGVIWFSIPHWSNNICNTNPFDIFHWHMLSNHFNTLFIWSLESWKWITTKSGDHFVIIINKLNFHPPLHEYSNSCPQSRPNERGRQLDYIVPRMLGQIQKKKRTERYI